MKARCICRRDQNNYQLGPYCELVHGGYGIGLTVSSRYRLITWPGYRVVYVRWGESHRNSRGDMWKHWSVEVFGLLIGVGVRV